MIKSIEIANFKCFGAQPPALIECAPITLLYGPTSAGKSTVTQALRLMSAQLSAESPGLNPFEYRNWASGYEWMGPYAVMRHHHSKPDEPIGLACRIVRDNRVNTPAEKTAFVRLRYAPLSGQLERTELGHGEQTEYALVTSKSAKGSSHKRSNGGGREFHTSSEHVGAWMAWTEGGPLQGWGQWIQRALCKRLIHVGPQRPPPQRKYPCRTGTVVGNSKHGRARNDRDAVSHPQSGAVGEDGAVCAEWLFSHPEEWPEIDEWMLRLGLGFTLLLQKDDDGLEVLLKPAGKGDPLGLPDVGYGVSQVLPVIVTALVALNQTITVEQPELHLDCHLQEELGSLFAYSAKRRGNQFIVETHSEPLCSRIQRLIREDTLKPADASAVSFSLVKPQVARARRFSLEADGIPGGV